MGEDSVCEDTPGELRSEVMQKMAQEGRGCRDTDRKVAAALGK